MELLGSDSTGTALAGGTTRLGEHPQGTATLSRRLRPPAQLGVGRSPTPPAPAWGSPGGPSTAWGKAVGASTQSTGAAGVTGPCPEQPPHRARLSKA